MTIVTLVRHAAHDRVDSILCGRMPGVTLGPRGREQAAALAKRLQHSGAVAVLTSPMERARETAGPVAAALGLEPEQAPDLNEIDFGAWTGQSFGDLASDTAWQAWNSARAIGKAPGGESMVEAQQRINGLLARLGQAGGVAVILVSHGDIIRAAVLAILGLSLDAYHRIDIDPASVTTLSIWPGGGKIVGLNERIAHSLSVGTLADAGRRHT